MKVGLLIFVIGLLYFVPAISKPILSIELGNEWLKVMIVDQTRKIPLEVAVNEESNRKTPAQIAFIKDDFLIGEKAVAQSTRVPHKVFSHLIRLLGQPFNSDAVKQYKEDFPEHAENLIEDPVRKTAKFKISDSKVLKEASVEELVSLLLANARSIAFSYSSIPVNELSDVVLVAPSWFSEDQVTLLKQSAELVGLNVKAVLSDLAAVAVQYATGYFNSRKDDRSDQKVLFHSIGTNSASSAIIELSLKGENDINLSILERASVPVGGTRFDFKVLDFLVSEFDKVKQPNTDSIRTSPKGMKKLYYEAQNMKEVLSASSLCPLEVEGLMGVDFRTQLSREAFETFTEDLYPKLIAPIDTVLAKEKEENIKFIELFGGGVRIPKLQSTLANEYKIPLGKHIDNEEGALDGAGHFAAVLNEFSAVVKVAVSGQMFSSEKTAKPLSKEQFAKSKATIFSLAMHQENKAQTIKAKNALESFLVDSRDLIESSNLSENEKEKALEILNKERDWLEENDSEGADIYAHHHRTVMSKMAPFTQKLQRTPDLQTEEIL